MPSFVSKALYLKTGLNENGCMMMMIMMAQPHVQLVKVPKCLKVRSDTGKVEESYATPEK